MKKKKYLRLHDQNGVRKYFESTSIEKSSLTLAHNCIVLGLQRVFTFIYEAIILIQDVKPDILFYLFTPST